MTWQWFFSNIILGCIAILVGFSPVWIILIMLVADEYRWKEWYKRNGGGE